MDKLQNSLETFYNNMNYFENTLEVITSMDICINKMIKYDSCAKIICSVLFPTEPQTVLLPHDSIRHSRDNNLMLFAVFDLKQCFKCSSRIEDALSQSSSALQNCGADNRSLKVSAVIRASLCTESPIRK